MYEIQLIFVFGVGESICGLGFWVLAFRHCRFVPRSAVTATSVNADAHVKFTLIINLDTKLMTQTQNHLNAVEK